MRRAWMGAGFAALALAALGAVLPVLPTTPFILLAAACFSRGSVRWHRWLRDHRKLGPMVRNWEEQRAIESRAKWSSVVLIVVLGAVSLIVLSSWGGRVALSTVLVAVSIFIVTRPTPRPPDSGSGEPEGKRECDDASTGTTTARAERRALGLRSS